MQNVLALLVVAVAVAYLALRGWRLFASRKLAHGCGSACGGCAAGEAASKNSPPLVTIAPLKRQHAE